MEEELEKYKIIMDNISDLAYACDAKGNIVYVNNIFKKFTGHNPENFSGKPFDSLFDEKNLKKWMDAYTRTLRGESPLYELCFKDTDTLCEYKNNPLRDKNGEIIGVVGIARDISERKQLQDELAVLNESLEQQVKKRTEELSVTNNNHRLEIMERKKAERSLTGAQDDLQSILDNTTAVIYLKDKEGRYLLINRQFEKLFFVSRKDIEGKTDKDLFPEDLAETLQENDRKVLNSGKSHVIEEIVPQKEKLHTYISIKFPLFDSDGFPDRLCGISTDITERKRVESALRESEQKYRRLIENLQDNYLFYSHNTAGVFTYLSSSISNILGYTPNEFLTHYSEFLTPNSINEEVIRYTGLSIKGIKQPAYPVEIYHKDGSIRMLNVQEVPVFDKDNNVIAVEGIAEDITERKKIEAKLMQSEKLMAMGVMTSGIAHEFNNILAIILGFAQLLKKGSRGDQNKLAKGVSIIIDAANDGADIVRRMQDFTNSKKEPSKLTSVDIRVLARQVIDFTMPRWKNMALANGITYHIDLNGMREVPITRGNPSELREVFTNVINNAFDAMPCGGTLSLSTWRESDSLFISFSDTGEGMCRSVLKKVFDPFFSTKQPEGSGLGLSSAFGIIRRHGGRIEVSSEIGNGSTFTICVPLLEASVHENRQNSMEEIKTNDLRILVVDDDQYICEFLREFLSDSGHYVVSVCCGSEAMKLLREERFDLVLCGLVMPDVTGRDVIRFLDTLRTRPKVGLITGWNFKMQDAERERLKVDFVVNKPIDLTEIVRCINSA
ncbi:MAG: PAS domain S-box protein [Candidatus Scalindua sp. AMX11]|nr:MAG: PAS domain S-box protein [Candidatus Scalindua sp.]NOG83011.1 PAS domain S-box protein [Planctomycetota bacterium]RZV79587.1 MAG: PAS domain S-box protein [Candidatus Scalindua sp. SCAELEC01]TDE65228.1 MAG: PAS domain S-box protein [Candidatus Scalindua sp. AMX11]GJQ58535.1 MAG: hypothetical protein SCALA701_13360 [Candidatus Scalindua sp.]